MSLSFIPLGWIYHDIWSFTQTSVTLSKTTQGMKAVQHKNQYWNRGHVHLFFPGLKINNSGSMTAYFGSQEFHFQIEDDYGL